MNTSYDTSYGIFENGTIDFKMKNPNLFTEAVIFDEISRRTPYQIKEFCDSPECKDMVASGVISQGCVERLNNCKDNRAIEIAAANDAREDNDELWDKLMELRAKERHIMNHLVGRFRDKHGAEAMHVSTQMRDEILKKKLPTRFIINEK